jgi:hypothetical protein
VVLTPLLHLSGKLLRQSWVVPIPSLRCTLLPVLRIRVTLPLPNSYLSPQYQLLRTA